MREFLKKAKKIEARNARIARFEELREELDNMHDITAELDDIYWIVTDAYGVIVDSERHASEYDARMAITDRLCSELERDEEFMVEVNKIEDEEERREYIWDAAYSGVDEVYWSTPYCELDGIEACLLDDTPEELTVI